MTQAYGWRYAHQDDRAQAERYEGRLGNAGDIPDEPGEYGRDHRARVADGEHRGGDAVHDSGPREWRARIGKIPVAVE